MEAMGCYCHLPQGYSEYRWVWRGENQRNTNSGRSFQVFSLLVLARKNIASRRLIQGIETRTGGLQSK